ncbi:putative ribonuclease H-like domain-containing protein [Tanacetum coccineum]|uniref:Ribonuclease H-like domain-containing protein n=1 Tax=Tanacetum coccineum TaxID=301880 RepID=A0ABQ4WT84_9ASTR
MEGSSKNLTKILNQSDKLLMIKMDRSSDEESTLANNKFTKANEYHVVPPSIKGNPLTLRANISFAGLDEYAFRNKIIKSKTTENNKTVDMKILIDGFVAFGSGDPKEQTADESKFMTQENRCDNETEFKNYVMNEFCAKKGIKREFSVARTPQQNGVAERKNNHDPKAAARTMLADSLLPIPLWAKTVTTSLLCTELGVLVTQTSNKTPYELVNR